MDRAKFNVCEGYDIDNKDILMYYQAKDASLVKAIVSELENTSVSCWIAERDLPPGSSYFEEVGHVQRRCKCIALFLSKSFVQNDHAYCTHELQMSVHEKLKRKALKLLPILLDEIEIPKVLEPFQFINGITRNSTNIVQCILAAYKQGVSYPLDGTLLPFGNNRVPCIKNGSWAFGARLSPSTSCSNRKYWKVTLEDIRIESSEMNAALGLEIPEKGLATAFDILRQRPLVQSQWIFNGWNFGIVFLVCILLFPASWYSLEAAIALYHELNMAQVRYTMRLWPYPLAIIGFVLVSTLAWLIYARTKFRDDWKQTIAILNQTLNPCLNILMVTPKVYPFNLNKELLIYKADLQLCKKELLQHLPTDNAQESKMKLNDFITENKLLEQYSKHLEHNVYIYYEDVYRKRQSKVGSNHPVMKGKCFCTMVQELQQWKTLLTNNPIHPSPATRSD